MKMIFWISTALFLSLGLAGDTGTTAQPDSQSIIDTMDARQKDAVANFLRQFQDSKALPDAGKPNTAAAPAAASSVSSLSASLPTVISSRDDRISSVDYQRKRFDEICTEFLALPEAEQWMQLIAPPRRQRVLRKAYKKLRDDVEKKRKLFDTIKPSVPGPSSYAVVSNKPSQIVEIMETATRVLVFEVELLKLISNQPDHGDFRVFPGQMFTVIQNKEKSLFNVRESVRFAGVPDSDNSGSEARAIVQQAALLKPRRCFSCRSMFMLTAVLAALVGGAQSPEVQKFVGKHIQPRQLMERYVPAQFVPASMQHKHGKKPGK